MNDTQISETIEGTEAHKIAVDMDPKMIARAERVSCEAAKQGHRRELADANWTKRDLIEIFGLGIAHRFRNQPRHAHIGKNYFTKHFHAGKRNPAGSKLLRQFIRRSEKEQHVERKLYAALTGRQYNHLNNPEQ